MVFQIMLPRNAREFIPKDIVLVDGICIVFLIHRSLVNSLCKKNSPIRVFRVEGYFIVLNEEAFKSGFIITKQYA